MTVTPLRDVDLPLAAGSGSAPAGATAPAGRAPAASAGTTEFADAVAHAFGAASDALGRADASERAFVAGKGGLAEMTLDRAQADVALSIASAATSRVAQSLQTILGMQV
ncbi:MAG: hypothetical protein NVS2B8_08150 [Vulcanimicrobiaceae bacterium]